VSDSERDKAAAILKELWASAEVAAANDIGSRTNTINQLERNGSVSVQDAAEAEKLRRERDKRDHQPKPSR
jgi:hypothetical protein